MKLNQSKLLQNQIAVKSIQNKYPDRKLTESLAPREKSGPSLL